MSVEINQVKNEGLERVYNLKVLKEKLLELHDKHLKKVAKDVKIPGFRPGKVPMNVIKERYGDAVMKDVLNDAIDLTMQDFFEDKKYSLAKQPRVDVKKFEPHEVLEYEVEFEILPDLSDEDFEKMTLDQKVVDLNDEELMKKIEEIAKDTKLYKSLEKDRETKADDQVVIDFEGSIDGQANEELKGSDYELVLGSKSFIDTFEDQLIGKKKGDVVDVNVTFPEDYHAEEYQGKPTLFKVTIKDVKESQPAKADDELAKHFKLESLDKLKEVLKKQLETEYKKAERTLLKKELFDLMEKEFSFDVPKTMLESEMKSIEAQQKREAEQKANHVHDEHCDHSHDEEDDLSDIDNETLAKRRVKLSLVLMKVAQLNNIDVKQGELSQALSYMARSYGQDEKTFVKMVQNNPGIIEMIKGPIFEDKVVDHILSKIQLKEQKLSADALFEEMKK